MRDALRPLGALGRRTLLEIGAGRGANVPYFSEFGFRPERMVLNELCPEKAADARRKFPCVRVLVGDAASLDGECYDVVVAATVFTSIRENGHRRRVAEAMWRLTKPGGGVLLYDFTWNNPWNPNVRKLTVAEIRRLFPAARPAVTRVTLAPPLARHVPLWLYRILRLCPWLRTSVVCWLRKE
jgi:SAM-dependent methyltransferase